MSIERVLSKWLIVLLVVGFCVLPASLSAQSCVLTRVESPVMNAFDEDFNPASEHQKWQASLGWRYGYSFRHFVGTEEQEHRVEENSQVVNNVNLADFSLRYNFNSQTSLTLGLPYVSAERSSGLRGPDGTVIQRYTRSNTSGVGDATLVAKRLLWEPSSHRRGNLAIGLGAKLPTGDEDQEQRTLTLSNGQMVETTSVADLSVQPGDGAWGIVVDVGGYQILNHAGSLAFYGNGVYIIEPEATNGIVRPGASPGEEEVSATDQYVARSGLQFGPPYWRGWSIGLGGRIEGIPVHDLFGSSEGRRRPGYMVSVEPTVSWTKGAHSVSVAIPWAIERNRQRSVADLQNGGHGDAAFPDYLVLASYARRF